jgi:hypothetical protein
MYATHKQIVASEKFRNSNLRDPQLHFNVITINLAAPIQLPDPKSNLLSGPTVQLVAKALPGYDQTILWLGHKPERLYHDVTFSAFVFPGDPFRLTVASGRECGS